MMSNTIRVVFTVTSLLLMLLSTSVKASTVYYVLVDNQPLALLLTAKDVSQYGAVDLAENDRFYDVQVQDDPQSKGRLAYIDGQWQGLLLRNGAMHLLNNVTTDPQHLTSDSKLNAQKLEQDLNLGACGVASIMPTQSASEINLRSLNPQATRIDYDSFCLERVGGVCLVAELTMVFDTAFSTEFGASYQSQAIAIVENVDLIYRNNFNIAFNRLQMAFGSGDIFDNTTDSEALLDDIAEKRYYDETDPFDPNEQSIMHLVTGRSFDGTTVGIANGPLYDNYPTPYYPVMCTYAAVGTSQIFPSSSNVATYTSLIVAHEIGHNFGFVHDGAPGEGADSCSSSSYIMGAQLNLGASRFSTCSRETLRSNINGIGSIAGTDIERCFDFPTDQSISADACNPYAAEAEDEFINRYTITNRSRRAQSTNMEVTGSITSSATYLSASLDGNPCTLSNGNTTYTCTINGASSHTLELGIQSAVPDVTMSHQVATLTTDQYEVNPGNNQLSESVTFPRASDCTPRSEPELESRGGGGGGGGGSLGWLTLGLLLLLPIRNFVARD